MIIKSIIQVTLSTEVQPMKRFCGSLAEVLGESILLSAIYMLIGTASNVILLAVGYVISTVYFKVGYDKISDRALWLTLLLTAFLFVVLAAMLLIPEIGKAGARYARMHDGVCDFNAPRFISAILIGTGIYGGVCIVTALADFAYLFFAGPYVYIARFIAGTERSLWKEVSFGFGNEITQTAGLIYIFVLVLLSASCYVYGYMTQMRMMLEAEQETAREKARAKKEENSESNIINDEKYRYEIGVEDRKIPRRLDARLYERLRALNDSYRRNIIVVLLIYFTLVIYFWYSYAEMRGIGMTAASCAPFPVMLILPFFPLKLHKRVFGKCYYAEVLGTNVENTTDLSGVQLNVGRMSANKPMSKRKNIVTLRMPDGESGKLAIPMNSHAAYKKGDYVFVLPALRHPVSCSNAAHGMLTCPRCGDTVGIDEKKCPFCKCTLIKREKY